MGQRTYRVVDSHSKRRMSINHQQAAIQGVSILTSNGPRRLQAFAASLAKIVKLLNKRTRFSGTYRLQCLPTLFQTVQNDQGIYHIHEQPDPHEVDRNAMLNLEGR